MAPYFLVPMLTSTLVASCNIKVARKCRKMGIWVEKRIRCVAEQWRDCA